MEKKRNVKKGKTWAKNGLVHLTFFSYILLFWFAFFFFYLHVFCLFPGEKQNTCKKTNWENNINAKNIKWTSHFVFPFLTFSPCFSPFILLLCFLDFADFLFVCSIFCICIVFFKLLILRISYGLVNRRLYIDDLPLNKLVVFHLC